MGAKKLPFLFAFALCPILMLLRPKTPLFDGFPAVVSVLSDITLCFYVVDTEDVKNGKGPSPAPRVPTEEASTMIPTLNRYWRLFNDPGLAPLDPILSPIMPGLGPPGVTTKAFLGLTQQVRTLTGMIQSIVPYIPQLAQAPTHQHPYIPRQTMQQEAPQSRSSQGERLRGSAPHPRSKPRSRSLSESTAKPLSRCYASPARAGCCFLKLYQLGEGTTSPSQPDARRGRSKGTLSD
ncbi:hypothetical protein GW17_00053589 [Ensete ventricosum]|nr:hypothetical protein GW17_00053589 [Ensete ventricosum]